MTKPLIRVANSGITRTGIRPRAQAGTFQLVIQWATTPASTPPMMPPMKPVFRVTAMAPMTNPGAMPGRSAIA